MISRERLEFVLGKAPGLTLGLLGDLFLDRYLEIPRGVAEMSVETGLEAYQVTRVRNGPGALGTVMNNLAALGVGRLKPVTAIGEDGHGWDLLRELERLPVDPRHIVRCPDRLTPTYTKPLREQPDGTWRELNRLDVRTRVPLSERARAAVCRELEALFSACDGLIVLDQVSDENQGVVHAAIREHLESLQRRDPAKIVFVDSRAQLGRFRRGYLKGNEREVLAAADSADCGEALRALSRRTQKPAFCTCGAEGILVASPAGTVEAVPAPRVEGPVDIVGAGDSATAGIVLALAAGANEIEAAAVGNLVASITIRQLGTTGTAQPEQVLDAWRPWDAS